MEGKSKNLIAEITGGAAFKKTPNLEIWVILSQQSLS